MAEEQAQTTERLDDKRRRRPARRAILEAARKVLLRDGADGLSPETVARESGMSRDIVYAYFCNRDELLLSIAADELSALSRVARDTENSDGTTTDSLDILELPKMVERFMMARKAVGAEIDTIAGNEDDSDDDEDQETMQEEPGNGSLAPRLLRRHPGRDVDGLVKEIAASDAVGEMSINAAVSRLERRVYVMERSLVERTEQAAGAPAKPADPIALPAKDLGAVNRRLETVEKHLADLSADFEGTRKVTMDRLRILEATPPAGPSLADSVPGMREAPVENNIVRFDGTTPPASEEEGQERDLDTILAAARQAARKAVAEAKTPERRESSQPSGWKRFTDRLLGRETQTPTRRNVLLTRVAPAALLAAGLIALAQTMDAGEFSSSTAMSMTAPGTVVALSAAPVLIDTITPMDQMMASAEIGDETAQAALGLAYLNGDGVAKDEEMAMRWLQQAADNGQAVAQYTLATLYAREDHPLHDPATALHWFRAAAEQDNRMAMNNLAMFYAQGLGTEADTSEAAHWFQLAAALGYKVAQFNLAVLYERGDGVPQNRAEAYKWYAIAAAQGDQDALARAGVLAPTLEAATLQAVDAEVAGFTPAPLDPAVNAAPQFGSRQG
jgi:TPR repeat protein